MDNTRILRKIIKFLHYDKPKNSLPILLSLFLFILILSNISKAALIEQDTEKCLTAVKDVAAITIMMSSLFALRLNPQKALDLIGVIEDDFLVSRHDFTSGNEKTWGRIEKLYKKKREDMKTMSQNLRTVLIIVSFGVIFRNVFDDIMERKDNSINVWPTPYLSYIPSSYESSAFFLYMFASQSFIIILIVMEAFIIIASISLCTIIVLTDFETIYILLDDLDGFANSNLKNEYWSGEQMEHTKLNGLGQTRIDILRKDMNRIVKCHQNINRRFNICANSSASMISVLILTTLLDSCSSAFFMLKSNDTNKTMNFAVLFALVNVPVFFVYHNGQCIYNQNDILRQYLAQLHWTDKPQWFKTTLHILMTRVNVDTVMMPYGIYVLNYMSFKDLMKTAYTIGNFFYTKKLNSRS